MLIDLRRTDFDSVITELLSRVGDINVVFDDGVNVIIPVRKLIFHIIFWRVGRKWGITLTKNHIVDTTNINSDTISKISTLILDDIRIRHAGNYHNVVFDYNEAINTLNNLVIDNCQEYHRSLSVVDLVKIVAIPEVKAIIEDKIDGGMPISEAESKLKNNFNRLFEQLKKAHPDNKIYPFTNLRFVSPTQLAHVFYQIGFRTDIGESIVRYPVMGNYLNGLKDVTEFALEALSAKKAAFYNKNSIPMSEYFGRRQHLLLSTIKTLYPGDCGTHITNKMIITEKLRKVVYYKNIVDGDRLVTLDKNNIGDYIGKVVEFRTAVGCKHQDGVCRVCAGELLSNMTPGFHVGIFSGIQTTSDITQVILSSKHMQGTTAMKYTIPDDLSEFMMRKSGGIYLKSKLVDKTKNISIMLSTDDVMHLMTLHNLDRDSLGSVNESAFGKVSSMVLLRGDTPITAQISLDDNGQMPIYSSEFIFYISTNKRMISIKDDMFIVDMSGFDFTKPIFKITVLNDSMVKFVSNVKALLEIQISSETSATSLINKFADLVYDHVHPNIAYLEVVLRAAMITGGMDLRIPVVSDINDVRFSTNENLNKMRSVGVLCAFQGLPKALASPAFFVYPKIPSSFDAFLNLRPRVE